MVLAGGFGTRLRPLTYTTPKPMLPLAGKPILHYIVDSLAEQGFDEIIITTNYLQKRIKEYFGDGTNFGVKFIYPQEDVPLGTAGSVKNAEKHLDETFVVIQGDNITDIGLKDALSFHSRKDGLATIALTRVENPHEYGVLETDGDHRITAFKEKPNPEECTSNLINTGLYVLEPEILDHIPSGVAYDFAKDLFPKLLERGGKLYGYRAQGFWVDVGRPESYMEAIRWMLKRLDDRRISKSADVKAASIKGRVWIGKEAIVEPGAELSGPAIIGAKCHVRRGVEVTKHTVLQPNVEVEAETKVKGSVIYQYTHIGEGSRLSRCIVAEGCEIGSWVKIRGMSVIGAGCKIGDKTNIHQGSRVWPRLKIGLNSVIRGVIRDLGV